MLVRSSRWTSASVQFAPLPASAIEAFVNKSNQVLPLLSAHTNTLA